MQFSTLYPFRLRGKAITCVYCCEGYDDPAHFRRHVDTNHQQFTISTAFAHMGSTKDLLKVDLSNLRCRLCSEPFEKIQDVAEHLKKSHENKILNKLNLNFDIGMQPYKLEKDNYTCYHCGVKQPTLIKLCRHTNSHYQKFTCHMCGRNYMTNETLKYHIRCSHSGNQVCRKCWKSFASVEMKIEHVRASKLCWPFCCILCGERFLSWELKQKHLVTKHGYEKVRYTCPECDQKFNSRKMFYTHYKIAHTEEGFECSCCGLRFGTKTKMEDHKLGHTGEKQFMCTICFKSFSRNKSLTQHMWTHSDSKRFVCLICEKQFAQKVSLKGHMKTHHPEVSVDI